MLLKDHAEKVAETASESTGVGFIELLPIIMTLIPMFFQMPCMKGVSARQRLQNSYDANTDKFDSQIVKRGRAVTRRAAAKNGSPHLDKRTLDNITVAAYRRAMEQPDQDVASAQAEAALIPNVEVIDG